MISLNKWIKYLLCIVFVGLMLTVLSHPTLGASDREESRPYAKDDVIYQTASDGLRYKIYGFSSNDKLVAPAYKEDGRYIECYTVLYDPTDESNDPFVILGEFLKEGTIDPKTEQNITIPASLLGIGEDFELAVFDDSYYNSLEKYNIGVDEHIIRNTTVNVFYSSGEGAENAQYFQNMYASITVTDEYSGNRKRHAFHAVHSKLQTLNGLPSGKRYVNTYSLDTIPDIAVLGWDMGGVVDMYDASISLQGAYNLKCEVCEIAGRSQYVYNSIGRYSSDVSMHETLFTGRSIGFNIPDMIVGQCPTCGYNTGTRPALFYLDAKNAWFNRGGYAGEPGSVRSEYYHTYTNTVHSYSAGFGYPFSVSVTPTASENVSYEKTWVYAPINSN